MAQSCRERQVNLNVSFSLPQAFKNGGIVELEEQMKNLKQQTVKTQL